MTLEWTDCPCSCGRRLAALAAPDAPEPVTAMLCAVCDGLALDNLVAVVRPEDDR